jgi:hypothetical protein
MNVRPRLVWAQVWEVMADYFAKIACHENSMVSVFAIDSLKQLSFKFLEKPELSEFNFQRTFLKPFLAVMEDKGSREDIRELVLWCVDNIIRTKSHNLRSGWKIVFSILTQSASDPSEKIDTLGLSILQRLLDEHLHELCKLTDKEATDDYALELSPQDSRNRNANVDDFVELCRASLAFIKKEEGDSPRPIGLSIRALCHTAIYADLIADKRVHPPMSGAQVRSFGPWRYVRSHSLGSCAHSLLPSLTYKSGPTPMLAVSPTKVFQRRRVSKWYFGAICCRGL